MLKGDRKPNCGVCGESKVERRGRMVCMACNRRYALKAYYNSPPKPLTDARKQAKYKNLKKERPSGLTNQKVYAMKVRYGVSEDAFIDMFVRQEGKCGICRKDMPAKSCLIDHNHDTGIVRGLLCRHCNFAIGLFNDNIASLQMAIDYLTRSLNGKCTSK